MAMAAKLALFKVVASVLSLELVSAVKTGDRPQDISKKFVRREDPEMTQDSNGSDGWQDPASEKMQVVLGSDALLSDGRHHEAKLTEAPLCNVGSYYPKVGPKPACKKNKGKVPIAQATYKDCQNECYDLPLTPSEYDQHIMIRWDRFSFTDNGFCKCCWSDEVDGKEIETTGTTTGTLNCVIPEVPTCEDFACDNGQMGKGKWVLCLDGTCDKDRCCQAIMTVTAECETKSTCAADIKAALSPTEWKVFQCKCMLSMPLEDIEEDKFCAPWVDCLSANPGTAMKWMTESTEVLAHFKFSSTLPRSLLQQGGGGLQQISGRRVQDDEDCPDECFHPRCVDVESMTCPCWANLKTACADQQLLHGQDLRECYRLFFCAHSSICHSWKTGTDGTNGFCTVDEINDSTSLLAVQGMQKPERTVLADIFQGRRQPPANISEFDAAALEKSLSGKACSATAR